MISLLGVCKEIRVFYLDKFRIEITVRKEAKSVFYMAREKVVHWESVDDLLQDPRFLNAINQGYRLKEWVEKVERLAVPISAFIPIGRITESVPAREPTSLGRLACVVVRMAGLRELRAVMWRGFYDVTEATREGVMVGMRRHLMQVERELEWYRREIDAGHRVPEVMLDLKDGKARLF
jgi:hypothetical protein